MSDLDNNNFLRNQRRKEEQNVYCKDFNFIFKYKLYLIQIIFA